MTDRDRLIELLEDSMFKELTHERLADHLLANGVIVPPCKMGDLVYQLYADDCGNDYCFDCCNECEDAYWRVEPTAFELGMLDKINTTVFLTKEDAEAKLKEMNEREQANKI